MTLYFVLYPLISFILLVVGFNFFKANKSNYYSRFFLISIFSLSIWIIIYLLSLTTTYNKEILIIYSRLIYGLDIIILYGMIFFILFYKQKNKKYFFIINTFLILLFFLSIFTTLVVKDMAYDEASSLYYEIYGGLSNLFFLLFIFGIILLFFATFIRLKTLSYIDKIKVKYISYSFILFCFLETLFGSILPSFGIRLFIKEQILFFIPFITSIFYVTYKYNFLDIKILIGKICNYLLSLVISILVVTILRQYFLGYVDTRLTGFWGINQTFGPVDLILGIITFSISYYLLRKLVIGESEYLNLSKKLTKLKRKIAFITSFYELNILLNTELTKLFKTNYVNIELYNEEKGYLNGLKNYFLKDKSYKLFINDVVFIEENKNKFNYDLIKEELEEKDYLIFSLINNKREFIGVFKMGVKLFQDGYTKEEIDILLDFVEFLIGHLKYLEIYSIIQELNVNLDKKIDEKTIEYNILVNKQNDFISMASHEIKNPLGSCIFQLDYLIEELKDGTIKGKKVVKELEILNNQLIKVGDLTKKIFSAQKYELGKIELYKQPIEINYLVEDKIFLYKKIYPNINFIEEVEKKLGSIDLDKIQFEQVIDNLIGNAIKFCNENKPEILIKLYKENNFIIIEIEDNGQGFNGIELESIFDKYTTGESNAIGLGMGMFLCKKIVELHGGNISAETGKELGGAKFIIKLSTKA